MHTCPIFLASLVVIEPIIHFDCVLQAVDIREESFDSPSQHLFKGLESLIALDTATQEEFRVLSVDEGNTTYICGLPTTLYIYIYIHMLHCACTWLHKQLAAQANTYSEKVLEPGMDQLILSTAEKARRENGMDNLIMWSKARAMRDPEQRTELAKDFKARRKDKQAKAEEDKQEERDIEFSDPAKDDEPKSAAQQTAGAPRMVLASESPWPKSIFGRKILPEQSPWARGYSTLNSLMRLSRA